MTEFFPDEDNSENIKLQAEERLRAAKELLKLGFYNDAISRAYYAMFSAVTLLFYTQGKSFLLHKSILQTFIKILFVLGYSLTILVLHSLIYLGNARKVIIKRQFTLIKKKQNQV